MGGRPERFINSLSFQHLTDTLELDLSNIHGKGMYPSKKEVHMFIMNEMGVGPAELRGVQHHPRFPKVHLQFLEEGDLQRAEMKVKDGLEMRAKKIKIFGYRCDVPMVTIIVNGQDMDIEEHEVRRVLGNYGTVVTAERGKNIDLSVDNHFVTDGTWVVRMTPSIRTKPPETIYYMGYGGNVQTWILTYDGVGSSCVLCGIQGHVSFRCNSVAPRGGKMTGRQPAGLGVWTDVIHCLPIHGPVRRPSWFHSDDEDEQQPGEGDQQQHGQPEGQVGQAGGKAPQDVRNNLFKGVVKGMSASQPVWGTPRNLEMRPGKPARQAVIPSKQPGIPGLAPEDVESQKKKKKNQKKRQSRKKSKQAPMVDGIPVKNSFDLLTDEEGFEEEEDETDEEEEKESADAKAHKALVTRVSSVLGSYGTRKVVSLASLFKKNRQEERDKSLGIRKLGKKKDPLVNQGKRRASMGIKANKKKKRKVQAPAAEKAVVEDVDDLEDLNNDEENPVKPVNEEVGEVAKDVIPNVTPTVATKVIDIALDDDDEEDDKMMKEESGGFQSSAMSTNLMDVDGSGYDGVTQLTQHARTGFAQSLGNGGAGSLESEVATNPNTNESDEMKSSEVSPNLLAGSGYAGETQHDGPGQSVDLPGADSLGSGGLGDMVQSGGSLGQDEELEVQQKAQKILSQMKQSEVSQMSSSQH